MTLRSPWVAVPVAVVCGLVFWFGLEEGVRGIRILFYVLVLAAAVAGPIVATVRLGREAATAPLFRRRLLALLALPVVAAVLIAWLGIGGTVHLFAVLLAGFVVAALTVTAVTASAAARPGGPGREGLDGAARSLWTLVLAGGVFCLSLPMGWGFQELALRRAKRWVEAAALEVRAEEKAEGRPPANLMGILERIGPPPRLIPSDGGYTCTEKRDTFEFRIDDPGQFLAGWWVYDGRTGAWSQESF